MSDADARWRLLSPRRERMVRFARRAGAGELAEDVVHDAMLRCAAVPELHEDTVDGLLYTTTLRLCLNLRRSRARQTRHEMRYSGDDRLAPTPDEVVSDYAEAQWLAATLGTLTPRQRSMIAARASGASIGEAAAAVGIDYRAAEYALGTALKRLSLYVRRTIAAVTPLAVMRRLRAGFASAPGLVAAASLTILGGMALAPNATAGAPARVGRPVSISIAPVPYARPAPTAAAAVPRVTRTRPATALRARQTGRPAPPSIELAPIDTPVVQHKGTRVTPPDEPLEQRVAKCLENGVEVVVTREYVGATCRES